MDSGDEFETPNSVAGVYREVGFKNSVTVCGSDINRPQTGAKNAICPNVGTVFRSESNGQGSGPQKPNKVTKIEITIARL